MKSELLRIDFHKFDFGEKNGYSISFMYGTRDGKMKDWHQINVALIAGCSLSSLVLTLQETVSKIEHHNWQDTQKEE